MNATNILKRQAPTNGGLRSDPVPRRWRYSIKKYFEKDVQALERRFPNRIIVMKLSELNAISSFVFEEYENHRQVRIKDDALSLPCGYYRTYIWIVSFARINEINLMDEAATRLRLRIDSLLKSLDRFRRIKQLRWNEREAISGKAVNVVKLQTRNRRL